MFDARRHANPLVFTTVVDRNRGLRKAWLRNSHGNNNDLLAALETPVNGGSATWTEVKGDSVAFIAEADILVRWACYLDGVAPKARLGAEYAPRAALTLQTVTDRHADRLFGGTDRELTATARCGSRCHNDWILV